jgi:papain like cysteine protease AvrRpt2
MLSWFAIRDGLYKLTIFNLKTAISAATLVLLFPMGFYYLKDRQPVVAATGTVGKAPGSNARRSPPVGKRALAEASGLVPLKQPSAMSCWATVYAMMKGWKDGRAWSAQEAVATLGEPYTSYFTKDTGLPGGHELVFVKQAGMKAEAPANYTLRGFADMLTRHGPLWIIVGDGISSHALIMTGLFGTSVDESLAAYQESVFEFVDPRTGMFEYQAVLDFMALFEREAGIVVGMGDPKLDLRWQVLHW